MKTSEQIVEDAKNSNDLKNYSLLEMHLYLCIEQILKMYANRQISKEDANQRKNLAIKKYEDLQKQYNFQQSMFQRHIEDIKKTETARIKLIKKLKEENEATEEDIAECLNLALEILSKVFRGEF